MDSRVCCAEVRAQKNLLVPHASLNADYKYDCKLRVRVCNCVCLCVCACPFPPWPRSLSSPYSLEQLDGRLKTFLGPASAAETTWQDQVGSGHRKPEPTRYPTRYPGFFSSSSPDPGACSARAQNDSSVLGAALLHSGDGSMSRTWLPWRHGQEWDLLSAQPPLSLSLLTSAASAQPQEPRADGGWRDGPRAGASASLLTTGNGLAPLRLATVWRNGVAPSVLSPVADRSCVLIHEFVNATERAAITMQVSP